MARPVPRIAVARPIRFVSWLPRNSRIEHLPGGMLPRTPSGRRMTLVSVPGLEFRGFEVALLISGETRHLAGGVPEEAHPHAVLGNVVFRFGLGQQFIGFALALKFHQQALSVVEQLEQRALLDLVTAHVGLDRKSTRLNSSHLG